MPIHLADLKSAAARSRLNVNWYEFSVTSSDNEELVENYRGLTRVDDDPSAAFLRFHITEYVEGRGKMSEALADWLLERVPIAPRRYRVIRFEAGQPVVRFRPPSDVPDFDASLEKNLSRRYWSGAACSRDRMRGWTWPPEGSTVTDPRTHHADLRTPTGSLFEEHWRHRRHRLQSRSVGSPCVCCKSLRYAVSTSHSTCRPGASGGCGAMRLARHRRSPGTNAQIANAAQAVRESA